MPWRKSPGKWCSTGLGGVRGCGVLFQETKNQRIALFFHDFDQQAKENIREMKKELDSLLRTAEKAFTVELLKMPIAIRKMKRKDLLIKVTTIVEYEDAKHISAKKISKKISKTKLLASLSPSLNGKLNPLSRSLHSSASVTEAVKSPASDCSITNFKATPKVSKRERGECEENQ
ncbi:borealin-2-like isoform X1 [Pezoporus flaviventris]|uniref:borealin-2-like isoform X1 n=1 Tax=Pezoporus flaviventris TaxID=889875 RepID=UPI002AAF3A9E|nr:borealin-2-like isoform X1 [Pezoporus flaviventris]XP_061321093.1 borealin-2-like isoform X1 [Pezoporus flaviventris]